MLAVDSEYRKKSIGSIFVSISQSSHLIAIGTSLVVKCINTMKEKNCDQVVILPFV